MEKFSKFYFESFSFDIEKLEAKLFYSFDEKVYFEENIYFSSDFFDTRKDLDVEVINNILFHIHLAFGISYYKTFPTNDLIVKSGTLNKDQISFWKKFYLNGLGEFLYTNKISPKLLFNFMNNSVLPEEEKITQNKYINFCVSNRALIPIGGGKDSLVSIELFKKSILDFDLFIFGKKDEIKQGCADIIQKEPLLIKREISTKLFELNKEGYYNGHVPITGLIAFAMELVAYIYDYKYLVLSNEKSANYGNINWQGFDVNHQYSKSLEFEKDFAGYVEKYISKEVKYFSLLRGMYEVKIAELFFKLGKKYFSKFSSCNNNFKINSTLSHPYQGEGIWCNNCSKCAFVFSILRPYLNKKEVLDIFGEDLFEKEDLEQLFRELLGISGIKPFECVGETEEVIYSMYKSLDLYNKKKLPFILSIFKNEVLQKFNSDELNKIEKKLVTITTEDIIPSEIKKNIIKNLY